MEFLAILSVELEALLVMYSSKTRRLTTFLGKPMTSNNGGSDRQQKNAD
jgi:hypothetical protein